MGERRLLAGARVFTGEAVLERAFVLVEGGTIAAVHDRDPGARDAERVELPPGSLLAPGFIDGQVNGGGGLLFNDSPTAETALGIAAAHRRFGTTGLLPTFITDHVDGMRAAAGAAAEAARVPGGGVLGVHLEGPFLNPERRGVHEKDFVRAPDAADMAFLAGLPALFPDGAVLLTLAPEMVGAEQVRQLAGAGLVLAGGHSAATFAQTRAAIEGGLRGFTHLFNAMPPVGNREPGIAFAAMTAPEAWCGIILDGVHVHPALFKAALALKPPGMLFLVTDAMPPTGTDAAGFTLYGQTIHRRDGRLVTDDGVLAGADIDMASCVRNAVRLLDLPVGEALRMASLYPARFLRLDGRFGRVAPGYAADLVLLSDESALEVLGTWVAGDWRAAA